MSNDALLIKNWSDWNKIPIIIHTYNRLEYLLIELNNLIQLQINKKYNIIIVDDGSTNQFLNTFLLQKKSFDFNYDYNINLPFFEKINFNKKLPLTKNINGSQFLIKNNISVLKINQNIGNARSFFIASKFAFNTFKNIPYIISIQDDIIFNKNIFDIIESIHQQQINNPKYGEIRLGHISKRQFNENFKTINNDGKEIKYGIINNIKYNLIGAQLVVITKKIHDLMNQTNYYNYIDSFNQQKYKQLFHQKNDQFCDVFFHSFILRNRLNMLCTEKSYFQHIGYKSIARQTDDITKQYIMTDFCNI